MQLIDRVPGEIRPKIKRKKYCKGDTILFAEQANNYVYFLISGSAEARIQNLKGVFAVIYIYKEGSFFGEIEQFFQGKKPVEIIAQTECIVDALYKDDFLEWLSKDFESTKVLIGEIAHKLIINSEAIEALSSLTIKERVLRSISIHSKNETLGNLTKNQLAKEVNAPIRSVNRVIEECKRQGIVVYEKKTFSIIEKNFISSYQV